MAVLDEVEFGRWQEQAARTADTARLVSDGGRPE